LRIKPEKVAVGAKGRQSFSDSLNGDRERSGIFRKVEADSERNHQNPPQAKLKSFQGPTEEVGKGILTSLVKH
jgi:hypothetical protein